MIILSGGMTVSIGLIDPLIGDSFSWTKRISKYFKPLAFLAHQSRGWIVWVVETKMNIFLGKCIGTL
jgi:hypothetical protein